MQNIGIPGAYVYDATDDEIQDFDPLSEDEYGDATTDGGEEELAEPPRPSSLIGNPNQGSTWGSIEGAQDSKPLLTPADIAHVRSMLPFPQELVTKILDLAEYWIYSRAIRSSPESFSDANVRYLQLEPIQGGDFLHPLRRIVITTDSKDQGWSSYPADHLTRNNSWTWFELTLDDGRTHKEVVRLEVMRNIHAGSTFETYRAVIEDQRVLNQARKGDVLSVWVRAMYPGWRNEVRSAKIEAWVAY